MDEATSVDLGFVQGSLERLRAKLLDLTLKNRLLNYKEGARSMGSDQEISPLYLEHSGTIF